MTSFFPAVHSHNHMQIGSFFGKYLELSFFFILNVCKIYDSLTFKYLVVSSTKDERYVMLVIITIPVLYDRLGRFLGGLFLEFLTIYIQTTQMLKYLVVF